MYWWIVRFWFMFGISGVYICVTGIQKNILCLGNSVKPSTTFVVWLSSFHHLVTIVTVRRISKGSNVRDYLVIFSRYVICRFHPTLDGAILPIPVVSSPSMGENIPRDPTRMLATILCVMCFMLWLVCVCSHIFIPS